MSWVADEQNVIEAIPGARHATRLTKRDAFRILQRWREVFSRQLHDERSTWILDGFDWHVFSAGYADAYEGLDAEDCLRNVHERLLFVRAEDDSVFVVEFDGPVGLPTGRGCDWYITARDFSWTFVRPHEETGPFFARASFPAGSDESDGRATEG
jgi:hypothetical protein